MTPSWCIIPISSKRATHHSAFLRSCEVNRHSNCTPRGSEYPFFVFGFESARGHPFQKSRWTFPSSGFCLCCASKIGGNWWKWGWICDSYFIYEFESFKWVWFNPMGSEQSKKKQSLDFGITMIVATFEKSQIRRYIGLHSSRTSNIDDWCFWLIIFTRFNFSLFAFQVDLTSYLKQMIH